LADDAQNKLYYDPPYQRQFVWNSFKTSYFIETVFLHAEFTPIVVFEEGNSYEVIDGRQRCETIDRFLKDELTLRGSGLEQLWYLADKRYSGLSVSLKERIGNAKIRVITIKPRNEDQMGSGARELVKREFFRRYNLGISPPKKEEINKARYLKDDINCFFKKRFQQDTTLCMVVNNLFNHKAKNIETQMQNIRQLLVMHKIPINRFATDRDDITNKYYDFLSFDNSGSTEKVRPIFNLFKEKIDYLCEIQQLLDAEMATPTGFIHECIYWALSICNEEKVNPDRINNKSFKDRLSKFFVKHQYEFLMIKGNHSKLVRNRYRRTAEFFSLHLSISFDKYLKNDQFVNIHKDRVERYMKARVMPGLEQDYFTKITPTSSNIIEIIERMQNNKFEVRPPYQRDEVTNKTKASALIESILLGLQLHPIFVFIRKDGVAEVIDGQQRLLCIIAFIGACYKDEHGTMRNSDKNNFSLRLKSGLLQELNGKKFFQLSPEQQRQIRNFNIDIIEIREENNPHFKPEELFNRLNNKPCPIKEHSFEFWNAYVDKEIMQMVKNLYKKHSWLYLKKNNARMSNEELFMYLVYLTSMAPQLPKEVKDLSNVVNFRLSDDTIRLNVRSKSNITNILENDRKRENFKVACEQLEKDFIAKLKVLTHSPEGDLSSLSRPRKLDKILQTDIKRTSLSIYLLWIFLKGIPIETVANFKPIVEREIANLFQIFSDADTTEELEKAINDAWASLKKNKVIPVIKSGNILV
jgi:hypothetical protein